MKIVYIGKAFSQAPSLMSAFKFRADYLSEAADIRESQGGEVKKELLVE